MLSRRAGGCAHGAIRPRRRAAPGYRSYGELAQAAREEPPHPVAIDPDDPFNIIYSSGTTGLPKGIVHTHAIREAYCTGFAASFRIHPESVVIHSGSLVFNGAFLTLMPAFYLGCTYVLMRDFDAERMIDAVERERATHVMLVPSQLVALLQRPDFGEERCRWLEMICSVGAPLHLEHKQELERRLPQRFYELYGLTEGFVTVLDRDDFARKPGSVGRPAAPSTRCGSSTSTARICRRARSRDRRTRADHDARLLQTPGPHGGDDQGRLALHGRPRLRDEEQGFLYLVDRKKDLIISGGVDVFPRDIEEVVGRHGAVAEVAVFGVADDRWGETPVAAVTLRRGETVSAEDVKRWVNERVEARYQKLSDVVVLDAFPRNAAGKTLRREIRERYLARNGER